MIFKRLNYRTLQSLRQQGYNILLTIARDEDENPIYFPLKLDSFDAVEGAYDDAEYRTFQGQKVLGLEEAIQRSLNNDLSGVIQFEH
jgi:hypothetical protein